MSQVTPIKLIDSNIYIFREFQARDIRPTYSRVIIFNIKLLGTLILLSMRKP